MNDDMTKKGERFRQAIEQLGIAMSDLGKGAKQLNDSWAQFKRDPRHHPKGDL